MDEKATRPDDTSLEDITQDSTGQDSGSTEQGGSPDAILDLIADVETQLNRMRSASSKNQDKITSLQEQADQLDSSEQELKQLHDSIRHQQEQLQSRQDQVRQSEEELQDRKQAVEQIEAGLDQKREQQEARSEQLGELEQALAERSGELESMQQEINEKSLQLDARHQEIENACRKLEELKQQETTRVEELSVERDALAGRLESMKVDLDAAGEKNSVLSGRLDGLVSEHGEVVSKLEQAEAREQEFDQRIESLQGELVEQGEQSSRLTEELAESDRQREIDRGEIDEYRQRLELTSSKLAEFAALISKQAPQMEQGAAAIAEVAGLKRQLQRQEEQISSLRNSSDPDVLNQRDERIDELTTALREARGLAATGAASEELASRDETIQRLRDRIGSLQEEIHRLTAQVESASSDEGTDHARLDAAQARIMELETLVDTLRAAGNKQDEEVGSIIAQKAEALADAANHLAQRKRRLVRLHREIRRRKDGGTSDVNPTYSEQVLQLQQQREQLGQVKEFLVKSEEQLMRRWARPRSLVVAIWLVLVIGGLAVGSYFATGYFMPSDSVAFIDINAEIPQGSSGDLDEEAWRQWHQQRLESPVFLQEVARRLQSRRIDGFHDIDRLSAHLDSNMGIDFNGPGSMRLSLAGQGSRVVESMLDTIASTLIVDSRRHASTRPGAANAVISGSREEPGRTAYATTLKAGFDAEHLARAGLVLAVSAIGFFMIVGLVHGRLVRSRRLFDQLNSSAYEDQSLPPI